jgi:hypothetical protein
LPNFGSNGEELYPHLGETSSLLQYFVFVVTYLEKPPLHWFAIGGERCLNTADLANSEYSWRRLHQNSVYGTTSNFCFNIRLLNQK